MIWLLLMTCITLLNTAICIHDTSVNTYNRASERLKWVSQNASYDAAYYFDEEEFSKGLYVFDDVDGLHAISNSIKNGLNINDDFTAPPNSFWAGSVEWEAWFIDDSKTARVYRNGVLTNRLNTTYPYTYIDSSNGFTTEVTEPTVIVKIIPEPIPVYTGTFVDVDISRTSSSELKAY